MTEVNEPPPLVITRFVVKPTGVLSSALDVAWEPSGDSPLPTRQQYHLEVRPADESVAWTRFTVRSARMARIPTQAVKHRAAMKRTELFEARVAMVDGSRPLVWSATELASALRPEAMTPSSEMTTERPTSRPATPPSGPATAASPANVRGSGVPDVHLLDLECVHVSDGIRLTASWDCRTTDGRPSWAPEFEITVRVAGTDQWTSRRTTTMTFQGVFRVRNVAHLDVRLRARLGGQVGAWTPIRPVAANSSHRHLVETGDRQVPPPQATRPTTPPRASRTSNVPPEITMVRAVAVPAGVLVTSTWRHPAADIPRAGLTFELAVRSTRLGAPWARSTTPKRMYRAIVRDTGLDGLELRVRASTDSGPGPWSAIRRAEVTGGRNRTTPDEATPEAHQPPEDTAEALRALRSMFLADVTALQQRLLSHEALRAQIPVAASGGHPLSAVAPSGATAAASAPRTRRELRASRGANDSPPADDTGTLELAAMTELVQRLTERINTLSAEIVDERARRLGLEGEVERVADRVALLEVALQRQPASAPASRYPETGEGSPSEPAGAGSPPERVEDARALARILVDSELYSDRLAKAGRAAPDQAAARALLETLAVHNYLLLPDLSVKIGVAPNRIRPLIAVLRRLLNIDGYDVLQIVGDRVVLNWDLAVEQFELPGNLVQRTLLS